MQQPGIGEHDQATMEVQAGVQIDRQPGNDALSCFQVCLGTLDQGFMNLAGGWKGQAGAEIGCR